MSCENYYQWQCSFCSACFQSNDSLQLHFEEYRLRAAELERCKAHAYANSGEQLNEALKHNNESADSIRSNTKCPHPTCELRKPFAKGQQLRVHFRTHIVCEEVCVCCFKVLRIVSEYIRHTRQHGDASETKKSYMTRLCSELRKTADDELSRCLPNASKVITKKRRRSDSLLEPAASNVVLQPKHGSAPNGEFLSGDTARAYCPATLDPTDKQQLFRPAKSTDVLLASVERPDLSLSLNIESESYQPPIDDAIYDPPLFTRLNFPQYPSWMDESGWLPNMLEATTTTSGDK